MGNYIFHQTAYNTTAQVYNLSEEISSHTSSIFSHQVIHFPCDLPSLLFNLIPFLYTSFLLLSTCSSAIFNKVAYFTQRHMWYLKSFFDPSFKKLSNFWGIYESSGSNTPLCEFQNCAMALAQDSKGVSVTLRQLVHFFLCPSIVSQPEMTLTSKCNRKLRREK